MKIVPVIAFSGRPPSAGGLRVGSRHVPVHVGGSWGSSCVSLLVSLYVTSVRKGVPEPSMLLSQRTFQKDSLPEKKARLTPAARAASTLARWFADQYSSWPTDRNTRWFLISEPLRSLSVSEK